MKTMRFAACALVAALLVSGCMAGQMSGMTVPQTPGFIYTHTWQPLTEDMDRTTVGSVSGAGDIKHLAVYTVVGVAWDSAAIGDIAKKQGLKELYFADLETFSVLRVWNQYTVHVYGK
jgi:hypothetical protein